MRIDKINNKLPINNQYDVELHSCSQDCKEYRRNTQIETNILSASGVNVVEPSQDDIAKGFDVAGKLGITYCYIDLTPQTSIYL